MPKDIEGCKDVIEKYVDAREVLPFMRDVVHRDDITDIVKRSNISTSNGTKELLNCLQRYPHRHLNVPSVWATFEMALKQAGYDFVTKKINGKLVSQQESNHEKQIKCIQRLCYLIYYRVDVNEVCPDLVSAGVISETRCQSIKAEEKLHGNSIATYKLMDSIWRLHENWFNIFLSVLRKKNYDDIAEEIAKAEKEIKLEELTLYSEPYAILPQYVRRDDIYRRNKSKDECTIRPPPFEQSRIQQSNHVKYRETDSSLYFSLTDATYDYRHVDGYKIYAPSTARTESVMYNGY